MKAKVGQYFFGREYGIFGIWVYEEVNEKGTRASKVDNACTFEEALRKTYQLNGWAQPKTITRKY